MNTSKICCICKKTDSDELAYGEWKVSGGRAAHRICLLLLTKSDDATIEHVFSNGSNVVEMFKSTKCYICHEMYAAVSCSHKNCSHTYHFVCGEKSSCLFNYIEPFDSYCQEHHGHSKRPPAFWKCQTCLEEIGKQSPIINSCCDQGWYHRDCMRKQAHFSGKNMKCPSCGEMDIKRTMFQNYIQMRGVYIPNRSALYPLSIKEKK